MDHLSASISKPAPESIAELEVIERQLLRVNAKIWNMIEETHLWWSEPLAPIPAMNQRSIDKQTALQQKVDRLQEKVDSVIGLLFLGGAIIPHEKSAQENMLENLRRQAKTLVGELYNMQPPETRKELIDMEQELKFLDQLLHGKKPLESYSTFRMFKLTELQSCVIELRKQVRKVMRIRYSNGDNENPILFSRVLNDEERALEWSIRNLQQKVAEKLRDKEMPQPY